MGRHDPAPENGFSQRLVGIAFLLTIFICAWLAWITVSSPPQKFTLIVTMIPAALMSGWAVVLWQVHCWNQRVIESQKIRYMLDGASAARKVANVCLRLLDRFAQEAILAWDHEGHIIFWNQGASNIFGYTEAEMVNQPVAKIIPLEETSGGGLTLRESDGHRDAVVPDTTIEWRAADKKGRLFPVELSITSWGEGDTAYYSGILRDITDRKRAEAALRQSENQYRSLVNCIPDVTWTANVNGNMTFISPNVEKIVGYTPDEVCAHSHAVWLDRLHPNDVEAVRAAYGGLFARCERFDIEYRMQRLDGHWIWLHDKAVATLEADGPQFASGILSDITQRKALEYQLMQSQKLEAIGQLAAGIAHEISAPTQFVGDNIMFVQHAFEELRGVLVQCRTLAQAAQTQTLDARWWQDLVMQLQTIDLPYLLEEIPHATQQALDGLERVQAIVRAMKQFAHPGTTQKVAIDLNQVVANAITVSRNEWKQIAEVITDYALDLPLVPCLPVSLNQAMLNVLINAVHAIRERNNPAGQLGTITVRTRRDAQWIVVDIIDTGVGIADDVRAHIFEQFFTTKAVGVGSGQGLSIARSVIVEQHGGTITCETVLGTGSTFTIRLPLGSAAGAHPEAVAVITAEQL